MQQSGAASTEVTLAINVVVLAYVLYRQVIARPVQTDKSLISTMLIIVGAVDFISFIKFNHVSAVGLVMVFFGLTVLAIGFAAVRAYTIRLWRGKDGLVYRQGTWATVALWLISITLHTLLDVFSGTHSASLYLYFGITLIVQRLIVRHRASKVDLLS